MDCQRTDLACHRRSIKNEMDLGKIDALPMVDMTFLRAVIAATPFDRHST
jgi:hypothetical protein